MLDFIQNLWNGVKEFIYRVLVSTMELLKDTLFFLIESLLDFTMTIISQIDSLLAPVDFTHLINFPPEISGVLNLMAIPQCLGIVVIALSIRLLLQLIPFTRLGS